MKYEIGFIGLGKMGSAILKGIIDKKVYNNKNICFYDVNTNYAKEAVSLYDISLLNSEAEVLKNSKKVILAIKPQSFDEMFEKVKEEEFSPCIISIAAGIKIETLRKHFGALKYIRLMPNTPLMIGIGSVAIARSENVGDDLYIEVKKIFEGISTLTDIKEEEMDIAVSASGSLPAYLYDFAKVFIEEAIKKGLSEEKAKRLVCASIIGSANMILKSEKDIDTLISDVCSKGGTTIAGLEELKNNNFEEALRKCFNACFDRSVSLGKGK